MSAHSTLLGLHTEVDKLIAELSEVCFDPLQSEVLIKSAQTRRKQLIDVRNYLLGNAATL